MQNETQKLVETLQSLYEGQNNEAQEYVDLLSELANYEYCMSDNFREALQEEINVMIDLENEWKLED